MKNKEYKIGLLSPVLWGVLIMCLTASCAVFSPAEGDFTVNRSRRSSGHTERAHHPVSKRHRVIKSQQEQEGEVSDPKATSSRSTTSSRPHSRRGNKELNNRNAGNAETVTQEDIPNVHRNKSSSSSGVKKKTTKKVKKTRRKSRDISAEEIEERDEIAQIARKLKGVKYKYGGKTPFGFDCSGYIKYVFEKDDVFLPPSAREQSSLGLKIALDDVIEGDLLFFGEGKKVEHVALVTSNDGAHIWMIHSTTGSGVLEEDLYQSDYWMERFLFAKDVLGE